MNKRLRSAGKWLRNPEWRTGLHAVTRNGVSWECWTHWCIRWRLCLPWYKMIWYDGPHYIVQLGICSLGICLDSNYREAHLKSALP